MMKMECLTTYSFSEPHFRPPPGYGISLPLQFENSTNAVNVFAPSRHHSK